MLSINCIKNPIIFFVFSVIASLKVYSQDYSYIKYDTKDGLAGSVVYDAIQDKEGFMWFATENGLSRFDGKNFKTFTTKDGLADNEILRLFLDSKGRLWIMPFRPSVCYYYRGKIYNSINDSLLVKIKLFTHAFDMAEDKTGNLFIAEERAWHQISNNEIVKSINEVKKNPISVSAVGRNASGEVDLLCAKYPEPGRPHFIFHTATEKIDSIEDVSYWPDIQTSLINEDYIIVPRNHSSHLSFYKNTNKMFSTNLPQNTVSISSINNRKIIINTRAGISFFDPQTNKFSKLIFQPFSFTSAYQDKENNLWLTTAGFGVLMVPSFQFMNYQISDSKENPEVTAFYAIDNTLYAGGWSKKIGRISTNNISISFLKSNLPEHSKIISINSYNSKIILSNTAYYQNPITMAKSGMALKSVYIGKSGILYSTNLYTYLCKWSGEEEIIDYQRSTCAIEKDSGFYIGTLNGLIHKSYDGKVVNLGNIFSVLATRIVNLAVSNKNVLWITTKGNGIVAYSAGKILYHFTETDGLTSDNCISLYLDNNTVWLGTEKGLNRIEIDGKENKITRFTTSDGLPSNVINAIATSGKKVFVGTPMGLTYFEVDNISQASTCDLQLTGIYISNTYWAYDSSNFSLPHKNNDVRFEFSGISFKSAGEIKYQYRLQGLQSDWITTTDQQLNFPSLPSGRYLFQLKAINKYGVESSVKEVAFTIEKLFWEKTWFRLLILFSLTGVIWMFFQYRIRKVTKKEKEQAKLNQHIAELEQKALRSQMNPHFIFNSLNSIQQYVAERDITGANNFITDFSRLIRMTLDLSTQAFINLSEEIDYITTYLKVEKTRLENQFDYVVNLEESINLYEVYLPPLLLQPYVENCIRHGIKYKKDNKGMVRIIVQKKENDILVSIVDNGVGREAAQQYKSKYHIQYQSKGMSINKDRIDTLNSYNDKKIKIFIEDLYTERNEPAGTKVDIHLIQ